MENPIGESRPIHRRQFLGSLAASVASVLGGAAVSRFFGWVTRMPVPVEANPAEPSDMAEQPLEILQERANLYLQSARKNITSTPQGFRVITPSRMYGEVYVRDSFFALVGLEDPKLSSDSFRLFSAWQQENGQTPTAIPVKKEAEQLRSQNDESTLLFLIWAGLRARAGEKVDRQTIDRAFSFVSRQVKDGWYFSPPGDFRYWADTFINQKESVITCNQGFFALALGVLKEFRPDLVSDDLLRQARENYAKLFKKEFGFMPLSSQTNYQDTSALLPELLSRILLGAGMLEDERVITNINHLIATASVQDRQGKLLGIKVIAQPDGSFLPIDEFETHFRGKGEYQNGAYWPMFTITALCLAYSINQDAKYKSLVAELMQKELSDGQSKEFISLSPENPGAFDPQRSDYSWNALIYKALSFAKMI